MQCLPVSTVCQVITLVANDKYRFNSTYTSTRCLNQYLFNCVLLGSQSSNSSHIYVILQCLYLDLPCDQAIQLPSHESTIPCHHFVIVAFASRAIMRLLYSRGLSKSLSFVDHRPFFAALAFPSASRYSASSVPYSAPVLAS